jgi:hypothetical protein
MEQENVVPASKPTSIAELEKKKKYVRGDAMFNPSIYRHPFKHRRHTPSDPTREGKTEALEEHKKADILESSSLPHPPPTEISARRK